MQYPTDRVYKILGGEKLKWDTQIAHINNKIAKNTGILFKLRHYSICTVKHLHYTLIPLLELCVNELG